jgi:hypothetical protein
MIDIVAGPASGGPASSAARLAARPGSTAEARGAGAQTPPHHSLAGPSINNPDRAAAQGRSNVAAAAAPLPTAPALVASLPPLLPTARLAQRLRSALRNNSSSTAAAQQQPSHWQPSQPSQQQQAAAAAAAALPAQSTE